MLKEVKAVVSNVIPLTASVKPVQLVISLMDLISLVLPLQLVFVRHQRTEMNPMYTQLTSGIPVMKSNTDVLNVK